MYYYKYWLDLYKWMRWVSVCLCTFFYHMQLSLLGFSPRKLVRSYNWALQTLLEGCALSTWDFLLQLCSIFLRKHSTVTGRTGHVEHQRQSHLSKIKYPTMCSASPWQLYPPPRSTHGYWDEPQFETTEVSQKLRFWVMSHMKPVYNRLCDIAYWIRPS